MRLARQRSITLARYIHTVCITGDSKDLLIVSRTKLPCPLVVTSGIIFTQVGITAAKISVAQCLRSLVTSRPTYVYP